MCLALIWRAKTLSHIFLRTSSQSNIIRIFLGLNQLIKSPRSWKVEVRLKLNGNIKRHFKLNLSQVIGSVSMSMARSNSVTPRFPCSLMTDEIGGSSFSLLGHLLALRTSSLFPMSQGAAKGKECRIARSVLLAQSRPILGDKFLPRV